MQNNTFPFLERVLIVPEKFNFCLYTKKDQDSLSKETNNEEEKEVEKDCKNADVPMCTLKSSAPVSFLAWLTWSLVWIWPSFPFSSLSNHLPYPPITWRGA